MTSFVSQRILERGEAQRRRARRVQEFKLSIQGLSKKFTDIENLIELKKEHLSVNPKLIEKIGELKNLLLEVEGIEEELNAQDFRNILLRGLLVYQEAMALLEDQDAVVSVQKEAEGS